MGVASLRLRRFIDDDSPELCRLYADTTRKINAPYYTPEQIARWAGFADDVAGWAKRLSANITWVAEGADGIVGFAELAAAGNIGYFYVHCQHQGQGIGTGLMERLFTAARELGLTHLSADVSISAMPFFRSRGFVVRKENRLIVCGSEALQYGMERALDARTP